MKPRGRPKKDPRFKKTGNLNMRVTPFVKEQITVAAARNNRSYAAEAEARLEWSLGRYHGDREAQLVGAHDALTVLQVGQGAGNDDLQ